MQIDTLQKLTIHINSISDDGAIVFSECLKTNTTLIELDLSCNNIGASAITEALKVNNALLKLNISSNARWFCGGISDDGVMGFSECLKNNTTLTELGLSRNIITNKGASAIAEALKVNNKL